MTDPAILADLRNTLLSPRYDPHYWICVLEAFKSNFAENFDQVLACLDGKPINVVNPEVLAKLTCSSGAA